MTLFSKCALASVVNPNSGLGFGAMGVTAFYGDSMPDDEALKLLKAVYDSGIRHYDTAEAYATAEKHNEEILGKFFKTVPRDSFTVATKYWPKEPNGSYEVVKERLLQSLKRLDLDYVDLYYSHRVPNLEYGKEFARTAKLLKEEGLIKEVGLSEVSGKWLKEIYKECPIDAVQQEGSLMTRNLEEELVPVCRELGVPIVAYSPLARNLLAAKVEKTPEDWRADNPRYAAENLAKNNQILDKVQGIAKKYNCSSAALSLAWLFQKAESLGVSVIPIPGTTKIANAEANMVSTKISIAEEDMAILEGLASEVAGLRKKESDMGISIESQT